MKTVGFILLRCLRVLQLSLLPVYISASKQKVFNLTRNLLCCFRTPAFFKRTVALYFSCRKQLRMLVSFISLLSCLHKVYAEAPGTLVFSGNGDKNVIAFLRMDVREKINKKKVTALPFVYYRGATLKSTTVNKI